MTPNALARQSRILALEPVIVASALKMARDAAEAQTLTQLTLTRALEEPRADQDDDDLDLRLRMFSLLRSAFHSVERQRQSRRERGFTMASHHLSLAGTAA